MSWAEDFRSPISGPKSIQSLIAGFLASRDRSRDTQAAMPIAIKGATRADFPALLKARGYRVGAEIGVYKGDYSAAICEGVPGVHLYCVDPWARFFGADGREIYKSAEPAYDVARERLATFDCEFVRERSPEAAARFANGSLDFVYIDADHRYAHVVADLLAWVPKVREGGIVAGHDFEEVPNKHNQVAVAVRGWTTAYWIQPWYVLGRVKVRKSEPYERERTWFWDVAPARNADLARRRY